MKDGTATYVYCLLRDPAPPDPAGAPAGLPGAAPPRLLALDPEADPGGSANGDPLWLVVADVPLPEYGEAAIGARLEDLSWVSERALAHEALVEHFAGAGALVPLKLFTLFAGDERAKAHFARELPGLRPALERVAGRVEWGVRVRHDPSRSAGESEGDGADRPASGRDFLLRKRAQRDAARRAPAAARQAAEEAYRDLAERAVEARRREPEAGTPLVLDAAFLVDRVDRECFVDAVDAAARRLDEAACELTLTGPWPPYNFVGEGS